MTEDQEAAFLARVKNTLDESEGRIDDITAARLRTLRREAVAAHHERRRRPVWLLPVTGLATAATVAVLAVTLWSVPPASNEMLPLDDIALLSDTEALEFYADLDFYLWLENEQSAS